MPTVTPLGVAPLSIHIQPPPRTVFVRMKDLAGSVALELDAGVEDVKQLIVRFHERAFAKSYAAFAAAASLMAMRPHPRTGAPVATPVSSLSDLADLEVLLYRPCDELRTLVEQGCITPVLGARAHPAEPSASPSSSPSSLKRKGRAASVTNNVERVHRYASALAKMDVSPREKEQIEDLLLEGDAQVVDAMEQFAVHRNAAHVRRVLRGPGKTPTLEGLSMDFSTLEMQSPAPTVGQINMEDPFLIGGENPFVRAAASFHDVTTMGESSLPATANTRPSMMMLPVEDPVTVVASRPSLVLDDESRPPARPMALQAIQEKTTTPPPGSRLALSLDDLDASFDESAPQLFSIATLLDNVPVGRDFHARYSVGEVLGTGKSSVVKECTDVKTGEPLAVKIMDKRQMLEVRFLKRELEIMYGLRHAGVVQLVALFETADELFVVMERCHQELFEYIDQLGPLPEATAQRLVRHLVSTVAYLHDQCIVHRDIKPENILIHSGADVSDIKLSDFGIARKLEGGDCTLTPHESLSEVANLHDGAAANAAASAVAALSHSGGVRNRLARAHTKCGTRDYVAPEVMSGKGYGTEADLWSVGVVTFVLLSGCAPVFLPAADGTKKVFFPDDAWSGVSEDGKRFIEALLVRNPEARATAADALEHPWLRR